MSVIEVQAPGLLTTVQDLGREGFGPLGVSPAGAADAVSLRLGNRLLGNPEGAAALEMTLLGGTFLFPQDTTVALAGSEFAATLDGVPLPMWTSIHVKGHQSIAVGPTRSGARCYLCIQGGVVVPAFLGSASTHLLSGLGGLEGRALRKGDVLQIGASHASHRRQRVAPKMVQALQVRNLLRVTPGPQCGNFPAWSQTVFYINTYRVSEESNRMGIRLEGPSIAESSGGQMITEGVGLGAVQITAGGTPIILFVEQQTTGGYAKIANVVSADLHRLGQLRPRDEIRFEAVDWDTAHALLLEQEKQLASEALLVP